MSQGRVANALGDLTAPTPAEPQQIDIEEAIAVAKPKPVAAPRKTTRAKPEPQAVERRGRPATGRRSNPDYERLTVYVPTTLRTKAERKWQDTTGSREASDLFEHLLTAYVGD